MNNKEIKVSFHGHSIYGDGLSTVHELVEEAGEAAFTFFGPSEHNTVDGLKEYSDVIDGYNQRTGAGMQLMSGIEITVGTEGHIVFTKPGYDTQFIGWAKRVSSVRCTYKAAQAIREAVGDHDAIVNIVHPATIGTPSLSFEAVRRLGDDLDDRIRRNVGLEVTNWMSRIFGPHTVWRENKVRELALHYDFAMFGGSDFHAAWMVPKAWTQFEAEQVTVDTIMAAVRNRSVYPLKQPDNIVDMAHLAGDLVRTTILARQKNIQ